MDVSVFLVADYASMSVDGKLNIIGVFNQVNAVSYPTAHDEMYLVVQLVSSPEEKNETFSLEIRFVDDDGLELLKINAEGHIPIGEKGKPIFLNQFLKLVKVVFPRAGSYEFELDLNGKLEKRLAIAAMALPSSPDA